MTARRVAHGRLSLALHELHPGTGAPLLLLHELGGSSAAWGDAARVWPGPAFALDFAGHGASDRRAGGAYTPELLAADADAALAAIGPCRIAGAGIGAYVALLLAGARPDDVPAALLLPGLGLDGGGAVPNFPHPAPIAPGPSALDGADPMLFGCSIDPRPTDYACAFGMAARLLLLAEDGAPRPPWWMSLRGLTPTRPVSAEWRSALGSLWAIDAG